MNMITMHLHLPFTLLTINIFLSKLGTDEFIIKYSNVSLTQNTKVLASSQNFSHSKR